MPSDKIKSLILASLLSSDPRYSAAVQSMAEEAQYMYEARALGVETATKEFT